MLAVFRVWEGGLGDQRNVRKRSVFFLILKGWTFPGPRGSLGPRSGLVVAGEIPPKWNPMGIHSTPAPAVDSGSLTATHTSPSRITWISPSGP